MKTLSLIIAKLAVWMVCWLMAVVASARINNLSWACIKSAHGWTVGYKKAFWDYMNDVITYEEHKIIFDMYFGEI